MYEQIKKELMKESRRGIAALGVFTLLCLIMAILLPSFIFGLISATFLHFAFRCRKIYLSMASQRFQKIEDYTGLTGEMFEGMLEHSQRFGSFIFINDVFFIDFRNDFVISFNKAADYKISDVYRKNGSERFDLTVTTKNGVPHIFQYPADMHDRIAELFRQNMDNKVIQTAENTRKNIEFASPEALPDIQADTKKSIDLVKHNIPYAMQTYAKNGIDLVKHNVPSAMQKNAETDRYSSLPVKAQRHVPKKRDCHSLSSINPNPDCICKPLPKFDKIIIDSPNVDLIGAITFFLVSGVFWLCAAILSDLNLVVNVFFFLWFFIGTSIFAIRLNNFKKELYFDLYPLGVKTKEQLDEVLSSAVRLSEYGFLTEKYLFMADTTKMIKLSDINGAIESEYYKRNRPVFAINIFTDTNTEMISFRNEKERDHTLDAIKIIIAQNELDSYNEQ